MTKYVTNQIQLIHTSNTPLSQDPLKWEHSTRTPGLVQWGPGTCPQHETIKFEVRQIPSSEIIECDRFLHVF